MRRSNVFIAFIVLASTGLLFLFGITALAPLNPKSAVNATQQGVTALDKPSIDFGNPQRGPADAPVTIVEYGDYLCQPCMALSADLTKLMAAYPGKIRLIWKDFPNKDVHPDSPAAAEAARCAGIQGAFWEYHDLLLSSGGTTGIANYATLAGSVGLNGDSFAGCMDSHTSAPIVQRDFEEGLRLRLDGTPYLFINDKRVSGALSYDQLVSYVEAALKK